MQPQLWLQTRTPPVVLMEDDTEVTLKRNPKNPLFCARVQMPDD